MEDEDDSTPFWVQSTTNARHLDRLRHRLSAVLFSSGLVVFLLLVTAVLFLVFVVPSSISFSARIFRPNSVKKSWDSLNMVLVLAAVVFGFLSRNKTNEDDNGNKYSYDDEFQESLSKQDESQKSSTPSKWYKDNFDMIEAQKWYDYSDYQAHKDSILTRNSSSYPDLREFSSTHWSYGDYYQRRRYYDDTHVDSGRVWDRDLDLDRGQGQLHRRHRSLEGVGHLRAPLRNKIDIVDTLLSKSKPQETTAAAEAHTEVEEHPEMRSPATRLDESSTRLSEDLEPLELAAAQTSSQPLQAAAETSEFTETPELAYQRMGRRKDRSTRKRNKHLGPKDPISAMSQAPPRPPSPPRQNSTYRKRGGATGSSTKGFLNSLYHKNKKKQRQKNVDRLDPLLHEAQDPLNFHLPPILNPQPPSNPQPPPHPPPSVFQNLFSTKKKKRKRTITVTLAPQTPYPPPPSSAMREPEIISQSAPSTNHKKPNTTRINSFDRLEEISNSSGDSPLNRIPPPPPPPPAAFFKIPAWKFAVQDDYVRVNSSTSSTSESPGTEDREPDFTPSAEDAVEAAWFHPAPLFCSSPDVNTKAESFITDFRAKLKLEKIHSMKKREVGLSGLGRHHGPSPFSQGN